MNDKQQKLVLKVAAGVFALLIAYIGLSSPVKVVIDEQGKIKGLVNEAREALQGKSFWETQLRLVQKEINWELGEPARKAKFDREMRQMEAEINREMREFYKEYPDMRPTSAERQAEALRERADAIEMAEIDRELEIMRRKRVAELRSIQQYLAAKLK